MRNLPIWLILALLAIAVVVTHMDLLIKLILTLAAITVAVKYVRGAGWLRPRPATSDTSAAAAVPAEAASPGTSWTAGTPGAADPADTASSAPRTADADATAADKPSTGWVSSPAAELEASGLNLSRPFTPQQQTPPLAGKPSTGRVSDRKAKLEASGFDPSRSFAPQQQTPPPKGSVGPKPETTSRPRPPSGEVDTTSRTKSVQDQLNDEEFVRELDRVMLAGGPFSRPKAEDRNDAFSVLPPSAHYVAELQNDDGTEVYTLDGPTKGNRAGQFSVTDSNWKPTVPPNGTYTVTIKLNSDPPLVLKQSRSAGRKLILKNGMVDEPAKKIKLLATSLRMVFSENDASALKGTPVSATFHQRHPDTTVRLNGETDENGSEDFPLPEGKVEDLQAKLSNGVIISRKEPIEIPLPERLRAALNKKGIDTSGPSDWSDDEEEAKPILFNIAQNATSCGKVVEWMSEAETRAVILGDISGSMALGVIGPHGYLKMNALYKSFREQAEAVVEKRGKFALIAWSSWLRFCPKGDWNDTNGASWCTTVDDATKCWISKLGASGGNDMRYAIEQAMRTYHDATDVWVMCDGDISPFVVEGGLTECTENVRRPANQYAESKTTSYKDTNWKAFCSRWPNVRFHFIAFHLQADRIGMPAMALEGGGSFSQYSFVRDRMKD